MKIPINPEASYQCNSILVLCLRLHFLSHIVILRWLLTVVFSPLTEDQKREYNSYVLTAKQMLSRQENHEALRYYQRAYKLHPSDKLDAKISKLMAVRQARLCQRLQRLALKQQGIKFWNLTLNTQSWLSFILCRVIHIRQLSIL